MEAWQLAEAQPERRCTGRRPKYGDARRRVEDVTPPEHVREDALRQARVEYHADVQRIKQKRLAELAYERC